jgi:hypothetical protein
VEEVEEEEEEVKAAKPKAASKAKAGAGGGAAAAGLERFATTGIKFMVAEEEGATLVELLGAVSFIEDSLIDLTCVSSG